MKLKYNSEIFLKSLLIATGMAIFSLILKIFFFTNVFELIIYPILFLIGWFVLSYLSLEVLKRHSYEIYLLFIKTGKSDHIDSNSLKDESEDFEEKTEEEENKGFIELGVGDYSDLYQQSNDSVFKDTIKKDSGKEMIGEDIKDQENEELVEKNDGENREENFKITENNEESLNLKNKKEGKTFSKDDFKQDPKEIAKAISSMIIKDGGT